MKAIVLTTLFILGIILTLFLLYNPLQPRLLSWGVKLDGANFEVTSVQKDSIEAKKNDVFLKIVKTNPENPKKFISDKLYLLNSLFEPTTSPYPEVLTQNITCPDEFKPKEQTTSLGYIYTLFAGERYNFGICSKDLVKYQALYGIFDCGKKGVFEISFFGKDLKDIEPIIKSFSC